MVECDPNDYDKLILLLNAPAMCSQSNEQVVSWHKPKIQVYKSENQRADTNYIVLSIDLGVFKKCGFYDWKLFKIQENGNLKSIYKIADLNKVTSRLSLTNISEKAMKTKPCQGRFIGFKHNFIFIKKKIKKIETVSNIFINFYLKKKKVHPQYTRSLQIHEVYVDFQGGKNQVFQNLETRGTFSKVSENLNSYSNMGINCLYLMGALERDNGVTINSKTKLKSFKRPNASPLAITSRNTPNTMLGGSSSFAEMIQKSKKENVKIIIDSLTRVSSARHHNKYRGTFLESLDDEGKLNVCFGTDGRSINFEDTILMNYRLVIIFYYS